VSAAHDDARTHAHRLPYTLVRSHRLVWVEFVDWAYVCMPLCSPLLLADAKQYLPENNPKVAPKPLEIIQPEGATFTVDEGNKLEWMGWDLTIGFNAREGLTLHSVAYTEPGTTERRPICYRASIAEMVVPYGSPNRGLWRKSVFDTGEAGLGKAVNSLELGCDCLGNIHYLDVPMVEEDGSVDIKKNAICIHEEDDGIMWKHKGSKGGKFASQVDMRRSTRLVISSISTVGNYEYGFFWRLTLDGQIECDVQATGIISTSACIPGQPEKYEYEVSRGVAGVTHQHTFCARLDMEVDGGDNTLLECDTIIPEFDGPGGENPYGNACYIQEHPVTTEGPRDINSDKLRYWRIVSAIR
jgi:primary-amine oxidase